MVAMNSNPSILQFLLWKIGKATEAKAEKRTHAHSLFQTTVKLMLHIVGFSCLTIAGFHWHVVAGFAIAGISCFLLSWLLSPNAEPARPQQMR